MPDEYAGKKTDLIQGKLGLLILKSVAHESIHGYGIAQRIPATRKRHCRAVVNQ
jgi:DNA-binding PadR family transcriptional regulator